VTRRGVRICRWEGGCTVHLWHGEQDPKVPITVARQLAASLPHYQTHFGTGGHLMACDHAGKSIPTVTSAFE
jgi:pimeloyl-ACP methyl ester carboxylesterase